MKKTFLFCTKLWLFITVIPPIALLIFSIINNAEAENLLKLYPLIIFSCAAIILIFLYFFRVITISTEEIKISGLFSSKDFAIIDKGKTLILTALPHGKIKVVLFGNNGTPAFNWAQGEDYTPIDIDLFREKAIGGKAALKRVLTYFSLPEEDIEAVLTEDSFDKEYENFIVTKSTEEKSYTVKIYFTKTI